MKPRKDATISQRKLMKWTPSLALLIVALMIVSSIAPVGLGKATTQKSEQQILLQARTVGPSFSDELAQNLPTQTKKLDDYPLLYHGDLYYIVGAGAGTWEGAMRLTPTELGPYDGFNLTAVNWYFYYENTSMTGNVKIYAAGDSSSPGTLLETIPFTATTTGVMTISLTTPLAIDGTQDLWVSVELNQPYNGLYPYGCDAGPAVDGKGDWFGSGGYWQELQPSLDINWYIEAVVSGSLPVEDIAVVSIDAPVSGTATGPITPQVTIQNNGGDDQTAVPVDLNIIRYGTPYDLFASGFETYTPGYYVFPTGWTRTQTNPTSTWFMYSSGTTSYPECTEVGSNNGAQDEYLISPTINCVGQTSVKVEFSKYFYAGDADTTVYLLGSTNGGATWSSTVMIWTTTSSTSESLDISSWAAGQANVKLAFRFVSTADTSLIDYFYFDNFFVGVSWGPNGDNPPSGWTITTNEPTPVTWDTNNWHRYAYGGTQGNVARIYWTPVRNQDDSLISPSIDCTGQSSITLSFWHYYYHYSSSSYGYVYGSTNGGSTWPNLIASYTATEGPIIKTYDISSWAAGQSNVKIRFEYIDYDGLYWYVDDFSVKAGSTTLCSNSFEGNALYTTTFSDYVPDNWGGWTWTQVTGTSTGNKWVDLMSGTSPTCMPHGGTHMAQYNSYSATTGDQARINSGYIDASAADGLKLKFDMFHDSVSYQSTADRIQIVVSTDGTTWTAIGSPFYRSCTLQGLPLVDAWVEHIVDLSAYIGVSTLKVGFLATSQFGYNMYIDDVSVFDPGYAPEISESTTVDIAGGQTMVVTFPEWTPEAWHTLENADMAYDVVATVNLPGDTVPENDQMLSYVTLHYPYFDDLLVSTIISPSQDGDAKTLPVKATIANIGQYRERDFFVPMQIGQKIYNIDGFFSNFETSDAGFVQAGNQWEWGVPTSGPNGAYSGNKLWATKLAGNYVQGEATLDSPDIIVPAGADLTFWHWYDFEASYDGYNVKISTNGGSTWTIITPVGGYTGTGNTANPLSGQPIWTGHVQKYWEQETFDLAAYEGQSIRIRFDMGADTSVFYPGAYVDDVLIGTLTITLEPEYNDTYPVASWIYPGESRNISYDDWTPAALAAGISGQIEYGVIGATQLPGDTNPGNDQALGEFTLSYRHDVGIKAITSPSMLKDDVYLHFDDGTNQDAIGLTSGGTFETAIRLTSTELGAYAGQTVDAVHVHYAWAKAPGLASGNVKIYDAGTSTTPGSILYQQAFTPPSASSWFDVNLTTPVNIDGSKDMWVSIEWTHAAGEYPAGCDGGPHVAGKGDWVLLSGAWSEIYTYFDINWNIWAHVGGGGGGGGGQPPVTLYIAPSQPAIAAVVNNLGTFPESDLVTDAKILSYVSDPNGTLVYQDSIGGITLQPLGGEQALTFNSYNFQVEGEYGLFVNIPLGADDAPGNNIKALGIGVDATPPATTMAINPAAPNGNNGWYITNVALTLAATDAMSGISSIMYTLDGGNELVYTGSIAVSADGNHTLSYYAIDKVGNKEATKSFDFKIDKIMPMIELNKEILLNKIRYTAVCLDNTSGMDYVEFSTWGATQFIDNEAPYVWILSPIPQMNLTVRATAYDKAGNSDFREIPGDLALFLAQAQTHGTLKSN